MSKVADVRTMDIEKSRVLFDTNVWILINGFNANPAQNKVDLYSAAYKQLIEKANTIVVNDYVLGEFFNRCTKLEYDIIKKDKEAAGEPVPPFKAFRRSTEFAPTLESIRDTCLNILDDCEFIPVGGGHYDIKSIITDCCAKNADFSDLILIGFCRKQKLWVMTDDTDYSKSGLDIITANSKMKSRAAS
jgi:hypothetical protein